MKKSGDSASVSGMRPRDLVLGVLVIWATGCANEARFNKFRLENAEKGHRQHQNRMGVHHHDLAGKLQKSNESNPDQDHLRTALKWYLAAANPTNHVVTSGETKADIVTRYGTFMKFLEKEPANQGIDFDALEPGTTIVIPGMALAMYNAGSLYESAANEKRLDEIGMDSPIKARRLAVKWYRLSANAGLDLGQFAYAHALEHGTGVLDVNLKEARAWYERSARQGFAVAQNNLANLYFHGFGDNENPNYAQAYYWYSIASNNYESIDKDEMEQEMKNKISEIISKLVDAKIACKNILTEEEQGRIERSVATFQPIREK